MKTNKVKRKKNTRIPSFSYEQLHPWKRQEDFPGFSVETRKLEDKDTIDVNIIDIVPSAERMYHTVDHLVWSMVERIEKDQFHEKHWLS